MNKSPRKYVSVITVLLLLVSCSQQPSNTVIDSKGMVVAAHPIAAEFGYEILQSGGNAVDAAVATAVVLGVVEPHASGFGGGGGMLIYLAEPDSLTYINYYARAAQAVPDSFDANTEAYTAQAVLVPGTVAGLSLALKKYGNLSWQTILERSIDKVHRGFVVDGNFNKIALDSYEILMNHPQAGAIYLKNMFPFEVGDTLVNKPILKTLQKLADGGPDVFYHGELADSIAMAMAAQGGYVTKTDLAAYRAIEKAPVSSGYRGYTVFSAPPPQSGVPLLEILNILEFEDLSARGNFTENTATFHFMAEAMKRGYADRLHYLSDPEFLPVPVEALLSDDFARTRYETIDMEKAFPAIMKKTPYGDVGKFLEMEHNPDGSTTHISVVDRDGNAVALTQTLNRFWGSGITVAGFLLNDGMTGFSAGNEANTIASGRQPRSTVSPTIIFKDDELYLVVGSPGAGRIISTVVEVICNIIDFGMTAEEANIAPRFCSKKWADTLPVEARFDQELLDQLRAMGHPIEVLGAMDNYFGGVHLIMVDPQTGVLKGSADPRRSGVVEGG